VNVGERAECESTAVGPSLTKARRFQFSLRTLFLMVTVAAVIIPKGLRRVAQGCRAATTLGEECRSTFTPKGLRNGGATRRNSCGVDWIAVGITQGSRSAARRGNPGLSYASPSGYVHVVTPDAPTRERRAVSERPCKLQVARFQIARRRFPLP
jgi:hypothetical protein